MTEAEIWNAISNLYPNFKPEFCLGADPYMAIQDIVLWDAYKYHGALNTRVMDVGANRGVFSALCACHGSHVVAYEPYKPAFAVLQEMTIRTRLNIVPVNQAIWTYNGQCPYSGVNSTNRPWLTFNGAIQIAGKNSGDTSNTPAVSCVTLVEAINNQEWDCVKIDVEGAEWDILLNAPESALAKIRFLTVELHNGWVDQKTYDWLLTRLSPIFSLTGRPDETYQNRWSYLYGVRK